MQFPTFEEAVEHEKGCTGGGGGEGLDMGGNGTKGGGGPQDPTASSSSVVAGRGSTATTSGPTVPSTDEITLFSPVLRDVFPNSSQISRYHRLILKSIRLLHSPCGGRERRGGSVSFHCRHCTCVFSPPGFEDDNKKGDDPPPPLWTINKIVEMLPSRVENHIINECEGLPAERTILPTAKSSGKMPFDRFIATFFTDNGIMDSPDGPGGRISTVVLPDEDFVRILG